MACGVTKTFLSKIPGSRFRDVVREVSGYAGWRDSLTDQESEKIQYSLMKKKRDPVLRPILLLKIRYCCGIFREWSLIVDALRSQGRDRLVRSSVACLVMAQQGVSEHIVSL